MNRLHPAPFAAVLALFAGFSAAAADIAIVHAGRLLATPGAPATAAQTVVIRDGVVAAVTPGYLDAAAAGAKPGDAVALYDLKDYFVLPGLIDGHVHITGELTPAAKLETVTMEDAAVALRAAAYARRTLEAGFTTVRNLGADPKVIVPLREAIAAGHVPGPRIFAAAGGISPTGGHGDEHGFRAEVLHLFDHPGLCDGADDCRRAVRAVVKNGADQIKLTATGGVLSETDAGTGQQFFSDELEAIIGTAHALGRRTAAHAHGADGVKAALRAGVDSIEHGTYADAEAFQLFIERGAFLVPTMLAGETVTGMARPDDTFMPAPIRKKALAVGPQMKEMVRNAHAAGVRIAFGTDSGVSPHGENAREFSLLVAAGLSPMEAIRAATVDGAANLGESARLGSLEAGKFGDLVAVKGDPLTDVGVLESVSFVMKEGVVYKRP